MSAWMNPRVLIVLAFLAAHWLYDESCCAGHDCQPVPCDTVHAMGDGSFMWGIVTFWPGSLKPSPDGGCHVCVPAHAFTGTCIYLPPQT